MTSTTSLFQLALLSLSYAAPIAAPSDTTVSNSTTSNSKGYVTFPAKKVYKNSTTPFNKRNVEQASFTNEGLTYVATINIGNPPQEQQVLVDTGSSDLWVWANGSGAPYTYNPSESSESHYMYGGFSINYVSSQAASGSFYNDTVNLGDMNFIAQFGVSTTYNPQTDQLTQGVMGISYGNSDIAPSGHGHYANVPEQLKNQGLIDTVAYSLYLNDYNGDDATLLFGAVDTSRFTGELALIETNPNNFWMPAVIEGQNLDVILDSGTSISSMPNDLLQSIVKEKWADVVTYDTNWNLYRLTTDTLPEGTITVQFKHVEIVLQPEDLWMVLDGVHNFLTWDGSDMYILGDTFLRKVYVVYDLENTRVGIAPIVYNSNSSPNYQPITQGSIPNSSSN